MFNRFQRDVIPETDSLRIKHYVPYRHNHRRYSHCKGIDVEVEYRVSAAEIALSVSKRAIKPETATCMRIAHPTLKDFHFVTGPSRLSPVARNTDGHKG